MNSFFTKPSPFVSYSPVSSAISTRNISIPFSSAADRRDAFAPGADEEFADPAACQETRNEVRVAFSSTRSTGGGGSGGADFDDRFSADFWKHTVAGLHGPFPTSFSAHTLSR